MENEEVHFRHVMAYEFRKGISVEDAHKNIAEVYLDRTPSIQTIQNWFTRFRKGDFSLEDKPCAGQSSDTDDDFENSLAKEDPEITTQPSAKRLKVTD